MATNLIKCKLVQKQTKISKNKVKREQKRKQRHVIDARGLIRLKAWKYAWHVKCDRVCAPWVCVQCMIKAWTSIHGEKCVKHTNNDRNMLKISKQGKSQSLVLIGVQKSAKMPYGHFDKYLVCTN